MKKKIKLYLRLNLVSIFFMVVSFISLTLAWFVYSGLTTVHTEVNVKAWYIEMKQNDKEVFNNITITMDDIYPGMEPKEEEVTIKNLGDSDAQVNYNIISARILDKDNYTAEDSATSLYVEDQLAHKYPFHINIDLSKKYVSAQTDETVFKVSISWPLDSGKDELDSIWGNDAYQFKIAEQAKKTANKDYQILAAIKLDISLRAEQYMESDETNSDMDYRLGKEVLYDVSLNDFCESEGGTCIRTNVIDTNNTLADRTVTLLPKISENSTSVEYAAIDGSYVDQTTNWTTTSKILDIKDVLKIVSKDITSSVISIPNLSDIVIGNIKYDNRLDTVINDATSKNGYFKFLNKFTYLYSNDCYWLKDYDENGVERIFAVQPFDTEMMKITSEKTSKCKVIPVIIANKPNKIAQ